MTYIVIALLVWNLVQTALYLHHVQKLVSKRMSRDYCEYRRSEEFRPKAKSEEETVVINGETLHKVRLPEIDSVAPPNDLAF